MEAACCRVDELVIAGEPKRNWRLIQMQRDKLSELITRKNERLEEDALRNAEDLIGEIVKQQGRIKEAEQRIAECRSELAALEVERLDQNDVLGGA